MKLKIFLTILFCMICVLSFGCTDNNTNVNSNDNVYKNEEKIEEITEVTTLATNYDFVTYKSEASTYFSNYLPSNVLDDDSFSSWVLNDKKYAKDEWIKISFDKEIEVDKLYILNGFGDQDDPSTYEKDNRVKTIEVEFSNNETEMIELEDDKLEEQEIVLEKPQNTSYVKLTIKDVYKGSERDQLTCIASVGINYPRVKNNDDEITCFNGIYGDYKIIDNKKFSVIGTYIDYKDGLSLDKKVQYLANTIINEDKNYYKDSSIKITVNEENSLNADLSGDIATIYAKSVCYPDDALIIDTNLLQYYYENDDWIKEITFTINGEKLDEYPSVNKEYIEKNYLNNEYVVENFIGKGYEEYDSYDEQETNTSDEENIDDYYSNQYTSREALDKLGKYLENNYGNRFDIEDIYLGPVYSEEGEEIGMGYISSVRLLGDSEGNGSARCEYFIDAFTGYIYRASSYTISPEQITIEEFLSK